MGITMSLIEEKGRIIGINGGFYTVETSADIYTAKPRGVFRKNGLKPMTGDIVTICVEENAEPLITDVSDRKNELIRPPLANLDAVLLVVSAVEPAPNAFVIDKLIAVLESKEIEPVLVFTKSDLRYFEDFFEIYRKIGFKTFVANNVTGDGVDEIRAFIDGKVCALIGNSGVGKSSLMNHLAPEEKIRTGEISKKLGRGRHTTRDVKLYKLSETTYIADTPGFSTVEVSKYVKIPSELVKNCFREFVELGKDCRFADCRHLKETDCKIRTAADEGNISKSRYDSYCRIYEEARTSENQY